MRNVALIIYILFFVYYAFVMNVFMTLNKNPCGCEKLEGYKRTWNFRYVMVVTPILIASNLYFMYKSFVRNQMGGGMVRMIQMMIIVGFGLTFVNDYAIISLFHKMRDDSCPCNADNRGILLNTTYVKSAFNIFFLYSTWSVATPKRIRNLISKANKFNK
jgi:hypothetical protein